MVCYLTLLYGDARHICANLPKVRHALHGFVAAVNLANEAIKNLNFPGVGFLVQLMDQDAVNQFMDILICKLVNFRVLMHDVQKPFYVRTTLTSGIDFPFQF